MPNDAWQGAIGAIGSALITASATILASRQARRREVNTSIELPIVAAICTAIGFACGAYYSSSLYQPVHPIAGADIHEPEHKEVDIPEGSEMSILVEAGTVQALTSGPICALGKCLPGGQTRGSVVILLPRDVPYHITGLVPRKNWRGIYRASVEDAQSIASDRARSMKSPGSCTNGSACNSVDVMIIGPTGILKEYTE